MKKRVVITGFGVVSPLGNNISETWSNLINGKSGVRSFSVNNEINKNVKYLAARLKNFSADSCMSLREQRRNDEFVHYAAAASQEALTMAGLDLANGKYYPSYGVSIGSGVGGLSNIEKKYL